MPAQKKRHGCLTAWLIFAFILNSIGVIAFLALDPAQITEALTVEAPDWLIPVSFVLAILGLVCFIAIFFWKKWGFWGLLSIYTATFVIDVSVGYPIHEAIRNLVGLAIWYGVLQIGGDNKGWSQLE